MEGILAYHGGLGVEEGVCHLLQEQSVPHVIILHTKGEGTLHNPACTWALYIVGGLQLGTRFFFCLVCVFSPTRHATALHFAQDCGNATHQNFIQEKAHRVDKNGV